MMTNAAGLMGLAVMMITTSAQAQEWYIPKRSRLLKGGGWEVGQRVQLAVNNDGLLDTLRADAVPHLRYAPHRRVEVYGEVPLSYSEKEDVVNFVLVKNSVTGIGDAFSQITFEAFSGEDWKILYNADGTYPTGKSPYKHRVGLGSAHYSAALGQTFMKVVDPAVLFMHMGYQHSFARRLRPGKVEPGRSIRFRFGSALSLNPRLQTTMHVTGDLVDDTKIDGAVVAGSSGNLIRFGWGLDWTVGSGFRLNWDAAFGMTKNTPDATLVHGWSFSF